MIRSILVSIFAILLIECSGKVSAKPGSTTAGQLTSGGSYYIEYGAPTPVPFNEVFSIDFRVLDPVARTLIKNARITARAWMPEHSHGTTLQPNIVLIGDGAAKGEGFLFHMEGLWELHVAVMVKGKMERAVFSLQIQ